MLICGIMAVTLSDSHIPVKNKYLSLSKATAATLQNVVSYLLATYIIKLVAEWRVQRGIYFTLFSTSSNVAVVGLACLQAPRGRPDLESKAALARCHLGRLLKLVVELGYFDGAGLADHPKVR
jgi:hypothetical protein